MEHRRRRSGRLVALDVALALLAGLVVLVLLAPAHGVDTFPPECFAAVGYSVPCDETLALVASVATVFVVSLVSWIRRRGR